MLASLPAADRPDPLQDLEAWSGHLPHRRLVRICLRLVGETMEDLECALPLAHDALRVLVALPGEWDLDDAMSLVALYIDDPPVSRDDMVYALDELIRRGVLVNGKESLRFVVPFPVRFCLKEHDIPGPEDQDIVRDRIVRHFSTKSVEEQEQDATFRSSWRLTNLLHAFRAAVEWLEEICGESVTQLGREPETEPVPRELAKALSDFGRALGPVVAKRKSDHGARWLLGAVVGARILELPGLEGDLFRFLGRYYRQNSQYEQAVECLDRARRLYLKIPDPYQACLMSSALALTHRDRGEAPEASREFELAWTLACEHGLESEKISIANCAGDLWLQREDPAKARDWFLRGWDTAQRSGNLSDQAELCNNLGRSLRASGRLDEALRWHFDALRISQKELNRPAQATAYAEIAHLWEEKQDPSAAVQWLERALAMRRDLSDASGQASLLRDLARCARANQQYADALDYATRARTLARRHGLGEMEGEICLELAELAVLRSDDAAATQSFVGALEHLGPTAGASTLAPIHFRLALILYRRGSIQESARHMLAAQALGRHGQMTGLLEEINPWLTVLTDQLEPARFESLVEQVTDLWETGELGGRNQESTPGGAPR